MTHLPALVDAPHLVVMQHKELVEVFTDFETRNRYAIRLPEGDVVLYAAELGGGVMAGLARQFFKSKRPFKLRIARPDGSVMFDFVRPWTWFFAELDVRDGAGGSLGHITQRFSILRRRFTIRDAAGTELAVIEGPLFRPWTFHILVGGHPVGKISKRWSGLLREAFSNADSFGVEFGPGMGAHLRTLVLAATFLIDFVYFEDAS